MLDYSTETIMLKCAALFTLEFVTELGLSKQQTLQGWAHLSFKM
jgi:hypothetical protein